MKPPTVFVVVLAFCCQYVVTSLYAVYYQIPQDGDILSFSGNMVIPSLPKAGGHELWPGLETAGVPGVLYSLVNGASGTWYIENVWCCGDPDLPPSVGFNMSEGETVFFSHNKESSSWLSTLNNTSTGEVVAGSFALCQSHNILFFYQCSCVTCCNVSVSSPLTYI
jgi:hypothetical protein